MTKRNIDDYKDRMTSPIGIKVTPGTAEPEKNTLIIEGATPLKPIVPVEYENERVKRDGDKKDIDP